MQTKLDRWRSALPGGNLGAQRSNISMSITKTTQNADGAVNVASNAKKREHIPSRLYFADPPSHTRSLILSPPPQALSSSQPIVPKQQNIKKL